MSSNPADFFLKIEITLDSFPSQFLRRLSIPMHGTVTSRISILTGVAMSHWILARWMEITFSLSCSTNIKSVDWKCLISFVKLFGKSNYDYDDYR